MRRGRIIIYLALLLVLGVGGLFVFFNYVQPTSAPPITPTVVVGPTATPDTVDVIVVTNAPFKLGEEIEASRLGVVSIPRSMFVEGVFMRDMGEAIGRRARFDLQPGVILSKAYLADTPADVSLTGSEAAFLIEKGKVAVSIPITRLSSVSYAPQRGDHVNVIVTLMLINVDQEYQTVLPNLTSAVLAPGPALLLGLDKGEKNKDATAGLNAADLFHTLSAQVVGGGVASKQGRAETDAALEQTMYVVPSEAQRPRLVSQTLIQNVMVLQVGTFTKAEAKPYIKPTPLEGIPPTPTATLSPTPTAAQQVTPEAPKPPDIITLVVSPQDAVTLNWLMYAGAEITLALRPVDDPTVADIQAVNLLYLLETYNIPVPVKLPYAMEPRVDELVAPVLPNDIVPTKAP